MAAISSSLAPGSTSKAAGSPGTRTKKKIVSDSSSSDSSEYPSRRVTNCLMSASSMCSELCALQGDFLVGRRVDEALDQTHPGLIHTRPDPADERKLPYRRVHRAIIQQMLHLRQDRRALRMVQL